MKSRILKVGDLFAGIGGIAKGFEKAGFDIAWSNEFDKNACITYRANHSHKLIEGDMRKLSPHQLEKINILTAGFPCQAFSIAGYRKGFEDDRGNLFFDILRFIDCHKPEIVFLENVKNLQNHDHGRTFSVILSELSKRGYFTQHKILNTSEYTTIPQNRERIYIVCFRNEQASKAFKFPKKTDKKKTIHMLIDDEVPEEFYYNKTKYYAQLQKEMINNNTVYQWRRKYVRENKSGLCPTLTANMGTGGHNVPLIRDKKDIRKLTPRECARFQGFDDDFILPDRLPKSALYKQIGNSVSIPIIELIARNIKLAITNNHALRHVG